MRKLLLPFASLLLLSLSGCCRYLGLCASASVHTSISGPVQYAEKDSKGTLGPDFTMIAQAPIQPATCSN